MIKRILIMLPVFFASCDCMQVVSGTIIDTDTKKPLDSVLVYKQTKSYNNFYTDTSGKFHIESISGGLFGCPGMTIVVEKAGYEKQIMQIDCGDFKTISLKSRK
ncbi:MAG TPA: carboxypeptidase-like regulatory domain-containing protein [Bacteroidia bacterium]|jgi:hypothetical protein|nr:carboxypeptidase-like regulatory domain-containing protein [Bacteroidia bacterium]